MIGLRRLYILNGKTLWRSLFCEWKRSLYSSSSLGIDSFITQRQKTLESIKNVDAYKAQLKEISESDDRGLIFLADLRKMIGIADSEEDLELLFSLIKKYTRQKGVIVFQGYHFGPEVMRLLHFKNKPDYAVELVHHEDVFPHLQHVTTITLLLDLLFKNEEFGEVVRMYELYQNTVEFKTVPVGSILVFLAACYKLNTAECFEKANEAHKLCIKRGRSPLRNALFFGALAIRQNQPISAIHTFIGPRNNPIIENLRCMAYAQAKRFDEVFSILRFISSESTTKEFFITRETLDFVEKEIMEAHSEMAEVEFQKLKEKLFFKNLVVNETLDSFLCAEVSLPIRPPRDRPHRFPSKERLWRADKEHFTVV